MKEKCEACKFYEPIKNENETGFGHCRHDRPIFIKELLNPREGIAPDNLLAATIWPVVAKDAGCGAYVENQITEEELTRDLKALLVLDVKYAAEAGFPYTVTGVHGLYSNREKLSFDLRTQTEKKFRSMANELIESREIVKCRACGSGPLQWLDVPNGLFAMGHGRLEKGIYRGRKGGN